MFETDDIVVHIDNQRLGTLLAVFQTDTDVESRLFTEMDLHPIGVEQPAGLGDGLLVDTLQHFKAASRVTAAGAKGGGGVDTVQAIGSGDGHRHGVFVDVRVDPYLYGVKFPVSRQHCCGSRRSEGDGDRFGTAEGESNLHRQNVLDGKVHGTLLAPGVYRARINSISIGEPSGRPATWMVDRAGGGAGKCSA